MDQASFAVDAKQLKITCIFLNKADNMVNAAPFPELKVEVKEILPLLNNTGHRLYLGETYIMPGQENQE
jgi:hypothetical protein